jgi:thiamine pyrophosphate-dependent acetolactate synthase large subunit-like protein
VEVVVITGAGEKAFCVVADFGGIEESSRPATYREGLGRPERVREATGLLLGARRPMVVVGGGVTSAEASPQVAHVADLLHACVVATPEGAKAPAMTVTNCRSASCGPTSA